MEAIVFAANVLYLAAYFTSDMLRLRALTVTAAMMLVVYFATLPEPMLTVVAWNLVFVALNVVQLVRLVARRCRRPRPAAGTRAGGPVAARGM